VESLLTPHDVCERLKISRKTLQRLCATRALGFVRVGGCTTRDVEPKLISAEFFFVTGILSTGLDPSGLHTASFAFFTCSPVRRVMGTE
jgi:excisionase family DNA binding protein